MENVKVAQGLIVGAGGHPLKLRGSDVDTRDVVAGRNTEGETTVGGHHAGKANVANYRGSDIAVHKAVNGRTDAEGAEMHSLQERPAEQRVGQNVRRVTDEDAGIDHLQSADGPDATIGDGDRGIADRAGHAEFCESQLVRGDASAGDGDHSITITGDTVPFVALDRDVADPRCVDSGPVAKTRGTQALEPAPNGDGAAVVKVVGRDAGILVFRTVGRDDRAVEQIVDLQLPQVVTQLDAGPDDVKIPRVDEATGSLAGDLVNLQRASSRFVLLHLDRENAADVGRGQGQDEGLQLRGRHRARELQL